MIGCIVWKILDGQSVAGERTDRRNRRPKLGISKFMVLNLL